MAATEPDAFLASISADELAELRRLLESGRDALGARLKEAGFHKLGQRMKVEARIRALPPSPPAATLSAAASEQEEDDEFGAVPNVIVAAEPTPTPKPEEVDAAAVPEPPPAEPAGPAYYPPSIPKAKKQANIRSPATKAEFDEILRAAGAKGRSVVVDFSAATCCDVSACQQIAPAFEALALEHEERCEFVRVDADANSEAAEACKVKSFPTFKVFKGTRELATVTGAGSRFLSEFLKQVVLQRALIDPA
eukprot:5047475-Prymnesium_polylepis.1